MKNKILNIGLALLAMVFVVACSDDDFTGASTLSATSPSLTVDLDFSNTETLVEDGSSYDFTVNLSEAQIANVVVYLTQTGGDATEGDDFTFPHTVTIPAGSTSASGTITILEDDLIEENESVVISIGTGNEANVASVSSETVTFNIGNLEVGELMAGLTWEASATTTTNSGEAIDATDLADLRLLLTEVPSNQDPFDTADGAGFESITLDADTPDGEYYLIADFYAAMDIIRDLDLTLKFDQAGVINGDTYSFPAALTTANTEECYFFIMAKVTKSGDSFTIENISESSVAVKSWSGVDVTDVDGEYSSHITTTRDCDGELIYGINQEWMQGFWGEEIVEEGKVYYTVAEDGTVTIEDQFIFTTVYNGNPYDYTITGTGTMETVDGVTTLMLSYNLDQEGFSPNQWAFENGYTDTENFIATVTMD